jgi:hypothetical protein
VRSISAPSRRAGVLAAAVAAALGLAGCGADDPSSVAGGTEAEPVGQELAGSVSQLAQCRDWVQGTEAEQLATVEDIRSHVNLEGTGVDAPALSDAEAIEVFDNGCDEASAQGYRLHIMYARAAAFKPLRDIAEGDG